MIKFSKMAILVIFILLVFMSPSFALDNETADAVEQRGAAPEDEPVSQDLSQECVCLVGDLTAGLARMKGQADGVQ